MKAEQLNKTDKFYCENCENHVEAEYECNNCGELYCTKCANQQLNYLCIQCEPPRLIKITN